MVVNPWLSGCMELLEHGIKHFLNGTEFDRREAMICIDNALELAIKTYISRNLRVLKIKRKDFNNLKQDFSKLLNLILKVVPDKISEIELSSIEHNHNLRNNLYHEGIGISINKEIVKSYGKESISLISKLYDVDLSNLIKKLEIERFIEKLQALEKEWSLDSFMVLPTDKSISNDESVLFLGCSVLPYIGKNIIYDNYLDLQCELDNSFTEFYEYHFQDFYAYRGMSNVVGDVFFTSVQEALEVLMPEITKQVEAKYPTLSNNEKITLINQVFLAAEKELSNVGGDKINVRGVPVDNIRAQIEKLLNGDSYGDWITFHNVEVNGLPVKFYLTRDIFYGKEILTFGNRLFYNNRKMTYQDLDIKGRNQEAIKMRMGTLRKIIKDNGGKVKIYVAQNFGVDYGYGYQYIFSNGISDDKIPTKSPTSADARCFVIDFTLNDGKPVDPLANSKLEFIISLSMTFSQPSQDRIFASDYLFDMKDFNSDYKSENSICLFDRRGFYSANDIHSYVKFSELKDVRFKSLNVKNVVFNGKDASFSELDKETGMWKDQGFLIISHKLLFGIYRINRWW